MYQGVACTSGNDDFPMDADLKADSQYQKRSDQRPTTAPRPVAVLSQGTGVAATSDWVAGCRPSFHRNVEHDFRRNCMFTIPCRSFFCQFWSALSLPIFKKQNCYYFRIPQSRGLSRGFPQVNLVQVLTV